MAHERAFDRLARQAEILGADAVLGVVPSFRARHGLKRVYEVTCTGTAVRTGDAVGGRARPRLALTSAQEFCSLRRAGIDVVGIVVGAANVEVSAGMETRQALRPGKEWEPPKNQELNDFTIGVYEARRLALERLTARARGLGASGVIGIDFGGALSEPEGSDTEMRFTVRVIATAVRNRARTPSGTEPVLSV